MSGATVSLHYSYPRSFTDGTSKGIGAENATLNLDYAKATSFRAASYEQIETNATYHGGVVRQHDEVSSPASSRLGIMICVPMLTLPLAFQYRFTNHVLDLQSRHV
jgi:hypothetical protein